LLAAAVAPHTDKTIKNRKFENGMYNILNLTFSLNQSSGIALES